MRAFGLDLNDSRLSLISCYPRSSLLAHLLRNHPIHAHPLFSGQYEWIQHVPVSKATFAI